jgi:hypothetical protein
MTMSDDLFGVGKRGSHGHSEEAMAWFVLGLLLICMDYYANS